MPRQPRDCAVQNTVVGTVASASYAVGLMTLADSAASVGFPCVVVQPFDWFEQLGHDRVASLPVPSPPLLPRTMWCKELRHQYGWRRSQLHRVRLWRVVLEHGLDLLAMDLDHMVGAVSPVNWLRSVYAPPEMRSHLPKTASSARAMPADVIAVWDGPGYRYLNVGIMWLRSTDGTRELSRRAENRSWAGWEQQVFNEELNFNSELAGVRCCHTACLKHFCRASNASKRLPQKTGAGAKARQKDDGEDRCRDSLPWAAAPPALSTEPWARLWTPEAEVHRSRHTANRKVGRCNHVDNVCVMVDATSGEVSQVAANRGGTLERPASNCTEARPPGWTPPRHADG